MRYFRIAVVALCAFGLSGCLRSQTPLNPPALVTARDTDMAIQLFMQATILLGRYYGFTTLEYEELRDRSVRHGYATIPFMPLISGRATPALNQRELKFELPPAGLDFRVWLGKHLGGQDAHRALITYYVQTGWRASQIVCRNYLVGLEERNVYLQFLQNEFNIGATLANASLIAAGANVTLRAIAYGTQWVGNQAIDEYQSYRYLEGLGVERDAVQALVETAQNLLAMRFLERVNTLKIVPEPPAKELFRPASVPRCLVSFYSLMLFKS